MLPRNDPDRIQINFDDHRLVANAGLILPVTLAQHPGDRRFPASGGPKNPLRRRVALPPAYQEHPVLLRDHDYSRGGGSDEWIAIHSNGIHTYPLQWTASWNG